MSGVEKCEDISLKEVLVIVFTDPFVINIDSRDLYFNARNQIKNISVKIVSIPEIPGEGDFFGLYAPFAYQDYICLGRSDDQDGFAAVVFAQRRKVFERQS